MAVARSWCGVRQLLGIICSTVGASTALTVICSKSEVKNTGKITSFLHYFSKLRFLTQSFLSAAIAAALKTKIFWNFTLCQMVNFYLRFEGSYCLYQYTVGNGVINLPKRQYYLPLYTA